MDSTTIIRELQNDPALKAVMRAVPEDRHFLIRDLGKLGI